MEKYKQMSVHFTFYDWKSVLLQAILSNIFTLIDHKSKLIETDMLVLFFVYNLARKKW